MDYTMSLEQIKLVYATAHKAHHALANLLVSGGYVIERFDTLSLEKKASFEQTWHAVYLQTIKDLQEALPSFDEE